MEYLVDNTVNKENFEKFNGQFIRENFIPFLGAGSSIPMGECNWNELFKKMKKLFNINVRLVKNSNGRYNYPRSFSNLCKKMNGKSNFFPEVFKNIEPTETSYTACHIGIANVFDSYITTNYDTPIEKAYYNQRKQKIKRHFFSSYGMENLKDSIVYLHGHKDIKFAILKEEDYDYFYPTVSKKDGIPIIESFLEEIYAKKNIVFIGFSFSDTYIYI